MELFVGLSSPCSSTFPCSLFLRSLAPPTQLEHHVDGTASSDVVVLEGLVVSTRNGRAHRKKWLGLRLTGRGQHTETHRYSQLLSTVDQSAKMRTNAARTKKGEFIRYRQRKAKSADTRMSSSYLIWSTWMPSFSCSACFTCKIYPIKSHKEIRVSFFPPSTLTMPKYQPKVGKKTHRVIWFKVERLLWKTKEMASHQRTQHTTVLATPHASRSLPLFLRANTIAQSLPFFRSESVSCHTIRHKSAPHTHTHTQTLQRSVSGAF